MTALLRTAFGGRLPAPTREYRARAWHTFEQALERHLARKQPALRPVGTRR